jgi:hypothetical protein
MNMAKPKPGAKITDVAHPGTTAPSESSKPIIVTNRPILKDPMVVEKDKDGETPAKKTAVEPKIKPLPEAKPEEAKPESTAEATPEVKPDKPEPTAEAEPKPVSDTKPETKPDEAAPETGKAGAAADDKGTTDQNQKIPDAEMDAAAKAAAEHEGEIQKLVDSKKYFLPINAVEQRRSRRFVALGIILSLLLIVAWVDIALDAGLISLPAIKPATHLFSN